MSARGRRTRRPLISPSFSNSSMMLSDLYPLGIRSTSSLILVGARKLCGMGYIKTNWTLHIHKVAKTNEIVD